MTNIEKKQEKEIEKDIKSSHFRLGDGMNDYKTTTGQTFKFDTQKAQEAKGMLSHELIKDLRSTHYKLGYDPQSIKTTTHNSTYTPLDFNDRGGKALVSSELRKSHFNLNNSNNAASGKSMYMTDFTKKEIPDCYA